MKTLPPPPQSHDPEVPFVAHLIELRKRLIFTLAFVFAVFLATFNQSERILTFLEQPILPYVSQLQYDEVTDPFYTHMKAAFYAALFLSFPVILIQVWLFIRPALYKEEKRGVWPFLVFSYPLFVGGALFVYTILFPYAFEFFINFDKSLVPSIRVGDYLAFVSQMMFVFGLVFELPLVSLLLTRMGLITAGYLSRVRRYAILIIFIVAAILTPPDVISQLMMAGPLLVLYEISIIVAWLARKKPGPKPEQTPSAHPQMENKTESKAENQVKNPAEPKE
ncbi:MAG: twin-arginine translocase subunit TatC [Deltaproteobacteria bacterium]|nr:twin-arginine translocase subunit TatC [Deltaproteobacteria bacterium]